MHARTHAGLTDLCHVSWLAAPLCLDAAASACVHNAFNAVAVGGGAVASGVQIVSVVDEPGRVA